MMGKTQMTWGLVFLLVGAALGWGARGCGHTGEVHPSTPSPIAGEPAESSLEWTCSMHPQIRLPAQTPCPLCGMDLVPVEKGGAEDPGSIRLSPTAQKLASVRTTPVRRATAFRELRLTGVLRADEAREREITAWIAGRVEKLHVATSGSRVREGAPLLDVYSPELLAAQEELVQSARARSAAVGDAAVGRTDGASPSADASSRGPDGGDPPGESDAGVRPSGTRTASLLARTEDAAREKLHLLGLSAAQIDAIAARGEASAVVTIPAPLSGVVLEKPVQVGQMVEAGATLYRIADLSRLWLEIDAYESDLAWVAEGDALVFETDAYPGERFAGRVALIEPEADGATRTVRLRVEVDNREGRLRPAMYARASLLATIGGTTASADAAGLDPLVIPDTAPLRTGERAVVYVADDVEEGRFHAREVVLGPRADGVYIVHAGLSEGERVVTRGAFQLDAALQIRGGESMMSPDRRTGGDRAGEAERAGDHFGAAAGPAPISGRADVGSPATTDPSGRSTPFRQGLAVFYTAYFETAEALSRDDKTTARVAFARALEAGSALESGGLTSAEQIRWDELRAQLRRIGRERATPALPEGIEPLRAAFEPLSDVAIAVGTTFGPEGADSVFAYHCPMAFANRGADWLQRRRGVENPYFGASMFRCGSETRTWATGGGR